MVTVRDILNYEGDVLDTKLNYPILALSIVTQVAVLHYLPSEYFPTLKKLLWVPILAFLMAFQVHYAFQVFGRVFCMCCWKAIRTYFFCLNHMHTFSQMAS